jgi:hypothetical protein
MKFINHVSSLCGAHDRLASGLTCTTALVPGGAKCVWLKSSFPYRWVAADIVGLMRDVYMRFIVSVTCGNSLHHKCMVNCLSTEHKPATK